MEAHCNGSRHAVETLDLYEFIRVEEAQSKESSLMGNSTNMVNNHWYRI